MEDVGQRVVMDVRDQLYGHILGQSASFFGRNAVGQLLSRVSNDVGQVQRAVSETAGDLARETLALIGYAVILFYIDPRLALVCLTGAPILLYPLVRLGQRIRRTARRSQEAQEYMSHVGAETFAAHRIVKAFGAEERETSRFRDALQHLYRTNMRVVRALSLMPPAMELLGGIGMAAALWYGSNEIATGRLTTGDFTTFLAAMLMMYAPAKKLSRVNANLQQAIAAAERIFEMLDTHTEVAESPNAAPLPPFAQAIEFRDVTFAYEDVHPRAILRNVTLTVPAGQMVAIVGRSGAGKTTLVNLIPRFYDVSGGAITIDGRDLREVTLKSLRAQVGIVTQETVLFDDTIANNIAYGAPRATPAQIEAAARAAHAHEFVVGPAREISDAHRRAWSEALRRAAAAPGDRPRAAEERAHPDPRRGDVRARHRGRVARAGRAGHADAESHVVCHRAPAVDDHAGRRDCRARARAHRRGRTSRRAADPRGRLCVALQDAVARTEATTWRERIR